MDDDLEKTIEPDRRSRPHRIVHRRRNQHRIGNPRFPQPGRFLDQGDADRFLRLHTLGRCAPRDLAPALRHGADPATGSTEPRSSGGRGAYQDLGKATSVITQNIDGLHQDSGIPDDRVIELHGNTTYAHCLDCGVRYEIESLRVDFQQDRIVPHCACGGWVKTATVSFGQSMPINEMRRAERETLLADLFIAIGSSLVVYPAAAFPELAKRNGAALVILNLQRTGLDDLADLVLNRPIGETLGAVVDVI